MNKQCPKCKLFKDINDFYTNSQRSNGIGSCCKKCDLKDKKRLYKLFPEKYLLKSVRQRCENINCKDYKDYGLRGIQCLITIEEIKQLMVRDNYWNLKRPSIDRIDNDGNYTFENCRFIEMPENTRRSKAKEIFQYDLQGNFIKKWESGMEVERILKIAQSGISMVLNNKRNSAGGFIWRYK